jgi:hypothetical protein
MSVSDISSSTLMQYNTQSVQSRAQQLRQEFQQLGQDLQSGNLSAAQSDFATLQQLGPQANSTSSAQSSSPIAQEFNQLAKDLQSGNLSSAQQDYTKIQQDFGSHAAHKHGHGHHMGGAYSAASEMSQLFQQLGQALQSGNVSTAQTAYSAMQQEFEQLSAGNGLLATQALPQSSSNAVSLSA